MKHLFKYCLLLMMFITSLTLAAVPPFTFSPYMYGDYNPVTLPTSYNQSPYTHVGAYSTVAGQITTSLTTYPNPQTALAAMPDKLSTLTLAFATGTCGSEVWPAGSGTQTGSQFATANIAAFQAAGKNYIISAGGSGNTFKCASNANMLTYLSTYYSSNLKKVDFDIEGGETGASVQGTVSGNNYACTSGCSSLATGVVMQGPSCPAGVIINGGSSPNFTFTGTCTAGSANLWAITTTAYIQTDINNLVSTLKNAQTTTYPNLQISFTVGTNGGSAGYYSLDAYGVMLLNAINTYGLTNWSFNLMAMQYTNSSVYCVISGSQCQMGQSANQAAVNVNSTYGIPYNQMELTVMIGNNGAYGGSNQYFTLQDVVTVTNFVKQNNLAGIHFWAFSRDIDGTLGANSDTNNGYPGPGVLGYTSKFISELASSTITGGTTVDVIYPVCGSGSTYGGGLAITTSSCPAATQGQPYAGCTLTATGGTPPYSYCLVVPPQIVSPKFSTLPEGMSLDPNTGKITSALVGGMGHYTPLFMVNDSAGNIAVNGTGGSTATTATSATISLNVTPNTSWMNHIFPSNNVAYHRTDAASTSLPVDTSPAAPLACMYSQSINAWSSSTSYTQGTSVTYNGTTYYATVAIAATSTVPSSDSRWSAVNTWSSSNAYTAGTVVKSGTVNYVTAYYQANGAISSGGVTPASNIGTTGATWTYFQASNAYCATTSISTDFGNLYAGNTPYGIPGISVPYNQPMVQVLSANVPGYSTNTISAPIPPYAPVEFTAFSSSDRHVGVYRPAGGVNSTPTLTEVYQAVYIGDHNTNNNWLYTGYSIANLTNNTLGPGSTAAGMYIQPYQIYYEEVAANAVNHITRFAMLNMGNYYVWPAVTNFSTVDNQVCSNGSGPMTHWTRISQKSSDSNYPVSCSGNPGAPYGEVLRLKASVYASLPSCFATSPQSSAIATGLANYGIMLIDGGFDGQITGTPDTRWNDSDLNCLKTLHLGDFEPVNISSLMYVGPTSGSTGPGPN